MDQQYTENTKRIAKNTVYLYGRMLLGMIVSLYTSRVILNALGVVDYGIQNVVGGFVSMFSLISSALSSSISRFITFELGAGNEKKLRQVFSTSLLIQIGLGLIVLLIAETVGVWFLNHKMVIPADRLYAANWIFQASVFSFIIGLLSCPYNALLVAYERMNVFAYFGIFNIFLNLAIVLFVAYAPFNFDKLIVYSVSLLAIGFIMQFFLWRYCYKHFAESHELPMFYKQSWKEMSGFAGWNAIGCTAGILKDQGVNVLINIFFGPAVNAARGIAGSVSTAVGSFSGNFMTAVSPQITKSYAAGEHAYLFMLVERSSRFGFYLLLCISLPIILETQFVLTLWLKTVPEYAVIFVKLTLFCSLLEILSNALITLQVATGKIRNYQIAVGGLLLMNFPVAWLALKLGAQPWMVYFIAFTIGIGCMLLRLWFLRKMVGLSMCSYLKNVVLNVLVTAVVAVIVPLVVFALLPAGFPRMIIVALVSVLSTAVCTLYVGCTAGERSFIMSKFKIAASRFAVSFSR